MNTSNLTVGDTVNLYARREEGGTHCFVRDGVVMGVHGNWLDLWCPDFNTKQNMCPQNTQRLPFSSKRTYGEKSGRITDKHFEAIEHAGYHFKAS